MSGDDGAEFVVRHAHASTSDPDVAFEWMRNAYTDHVPQLHGDAGRFRFTSTSISAGPIDLTEMRHSMGFVGPSQPADKVIVMAPRAGTRMRIRCERQDVVEPLMLAPTWAPFVGQWDDMDLETVTLDLGWVADYAEHVHGIPADGFTFSGPCPLSPALARFWWSTIAHVRQNVLTDPWASTQPIVLGQTYEILANAVLTVFPNSARAAATDPEGGIRVGRVSAATAREITDYLRSNADRPLGPGDIAAAADAPYPDVVDGLRRHRGTHPAEELWRSRLRGAFRALLAADPGVDTVAAVAARWGFTQSAQFAVAYLYAVGETPEQTLRR